MERTPVTKSLSLEDFLKEMKKGEQTLLWDAILVFDRLKTNVLLAQQYIDRFAEGTYFPVFPSSEFLVGENSYHALLGLVMARPKLSFENASLVNSKAMLTLNIVGGKHVQFSETYHNSKPIRKVQRLANQNAAAGAALYMDINLNAVPGTIEKGGKVMLDILEGMTPRFSGVATETEKEILGQHLHGIIKSDWGTEITRFELSELAPSEDPLFNPGRFGVRTQAAPKGKVLGAEEYGDGAVVVFVAMQGREPGRYPELESDLLYMLPDFYSSSLVLRNNFIFSEVLMPWFNSVEVLKEAKLEPAVIDGRFGYAATAGGFEMLPHRGPYANDFGVGFVNVGGIKLSFADDDARFKVRLEDDRLRFLWKPGKRTVGYSWEVVDQKIPPSGYEGGGNIDYELSIDVAFKFSVDEKDGKTLLVLALDETASASEFKVSSGVDYSDQYEEVYAKMLVDTLEREVAKIAPALAKVAPQLDAFRLNNLLFKGLNIVLPRDVYWPFDLAVLGDLAPERTEFVIGPSELIVSAGGTAKFEASTVTDVTWKVENLPGEDEERGDIVDGVYTAPPVDDDLRAKGHRQLIVTATSNGKTSKAMIRLVESEISVYPLVATVSLGASHSMLANTPRNTELKWSQPPEGLGKIEAYVDPINGAGYKYSAPTSLPEVSGNEPLHYYAIRLVPIAIADPAGSSKGTIDMLAVGGRSGSYWLETQVGANGACVLTFYRQLRNGTVEEVPDSATEWTLLKGKGKLNKGVFTPEPGTNDKYAIIVAFYDDGESIDRFDDVILPLPFIDEDRFVSLGLATKAV